MMRYEDILADVSDRAGLPQGNAHVEPMVRVVTESLAGLVDRSLGLRIADELPPPLDEVARQAARWAVKPDNVEAVDLYRRMGTRLWVPIGTALEQAQVVCQTLGRVLNRETSEQLQRIFGDSGELLFTQRRHTAPMRIARRRSGHTLADGCPSSSHPLSEAAIEGHAHGHAHSVANPNPHAASKISSGAKADDIAEGRAAR